MFYIILTTICIILCVTSSPDPSQIHNLPFQYKGWGFTPNFDPAHHIKWTSLINSNCKASLRNASFNLGPLHLSSKHEGQLKYYSVKDERSEDNPDDDYEYAFNICGAVLDYPDTKCEGTTTPVPRNNYFQYCDNNTFVSDTDHSTCGIPFTNYSRRVYAYQQKINADGTVAACYPLSDEGGGPGIWSLLSNDNPSRGVVVTYFDGEWSNYCQHNRQIEIQFVCDNDHNVFGIPGKSKSEVDYAIGNANEIVECQYRLEFHTIYGCPTECPIVDNKVCNGVGLCGYDWSISKPRCFCYSMFKGDSCTQVDLSFMFKAKKPLKTPDASETVHKFDHTLAGPKNKDYPMKVTYAYQEWKLDDSTDPYIMFDTAGERFSYYWNFMGEIDHEAVSAYYPNGSMSDKTLHDVGCDTTGGYCDSPGEGCTTVSGEGYVYQLDAELNCRMIGGSSISWELYDTDNPARGVVVKFQNGDYCSGTNKNAQFKLTMLCPDNNKRYLPPADHKHFNISVEEDDYDFCWFHTTIESAFACPDECITDATDTKDVKDDVSICNYRGMCAADPFAKPAQVHCLCDGDSTGQFCEEDYVAPATPVKYKNQGSYIAAIVIISIILVAICYFGYKKISQHKQRVKELEIKLVNYQSSGGAGAGATFEDKPQIDDMPQAKGNSLKDKIKDKLKRNKKGKYSNLSNNDNDDDEQELFNVKVSMGAHDDDSSNDDDDDDDNDKYKKRKKKKQKPKKKDYQIGSDESDNDDDDDDGDSDDQV